MIYRFLILSDEIDQFAREIEINSDATFLEFNDAILSAVNFSKDQLTSFFVCNDGWEKLQEITLMEMDTNSETDSYLMEQTPIEEFITEDGQRLIFEFDNLTERSFFIELKEVKPGHVKTAKCISSKGPAPKQVSDDNLLIDTSVALKNDLDSEFYGDSEYDIDELGEDGYGDFSVDDLSDTY